MPRVALDKEPRFSTSETKSNERRCDAGVDAGNAQPADSDAPLTSRRSLKRTASSASLLLTPPRTVRRKNKRRRVGASKRSQSRTPSTLSTRSVRSTRSSRSGKSYISSEDEDEEEERGKEDLENTDNISLRSGSSIGRRLDFGRKKRRVDVDSRLDALLDALSGEDTDNPFWESAVETTIAASSSAPPLSSSAEVSGTKSSGGRDLWDGLTDSREDEPFEKSNRTDDEKNDEDKDADKGEDQSDEKGGTRKITFKDLRSPSPPLLRYKVKAPVSPPPSNRKRPIVEDEEVEQPGELQSLQLPSTPKGKKRKSLKLPSPPVRDTPNNPFLDVEDDSPLSVTDEPAEPRTPTAQAEKSTITYVFRGVRATFANPMYNLPQEVHERSVLPLEHPDFSPDPACPPKLLFSEAHKARKRPGSPSPARIAKKVPKDKAMNGKGKEKERDNLLDDFDGATEPATPKKSEVVNGWDESDDEDGLLHITPPKRLFAE